MTTKLRFFIFGLVLAAFASTLPAGGHEIWPFGVVSEPSPTVVVIVAGGLPLGVFVDD